MYQIPPYRVFLRPAGACVIWRRRDNSFYYARQWTVDASVIANATEVPFGTLSYFRYLHTYTDSRQLQDYCSWALSRFSSAYRRIYFKEQYWQPDDFLRIRRLYKSRVYQELVRDKDWWGLLDYINELNLPNELLEDAFRPAGSNIVRADCGHYELVNNLERDVSGYTYCEQCAEDLIETVEGDLVHHESAYFWDGEWHSVPEPDDDAYYSSPLLRNYGASTKNLAHRSAPKGDFTLGIELEVETTQARYRNDALEDTDSQLNDDGEYVMFKKDGSLDDLCGFEIVTAARPLRDHIIKFNDWVPHEKLIAWDASSCGMHVHIDSRAFTALSLGKFLVFMNSDANALFIKSIAGRHPRYDQSAANYANSLPGEHNPASIKKGAGYSRYKLVNLTNIKYNEAQRLRVEVSEDSKGSYSTVELRVFKATLSKDRLLAQIEFTHAAVVFCGAASMNALNETGFKSWLAVTPGYSHLKAFIGLKKKVSAPDKMVNKKEYRKSRCAA